MIEALSFFVENRANLKSDILSLIIWIEENIIAKLVKNKINMKDNEVESCMRLGSVIFYEAKKEEDLSLSIEVLTQLCDNYAGCIPLIASQEVV